MAHRRHHKGSKLGAAVIAAACIGIAGGAACAQDRLVADFADPPPGVRPMLRWWWPGGDVTKRGLEAEFQAALNAGFGGVEIQPFRAGLFDATGAEAARIDSYGSPDFFARIGDVARFAAAHGVVVDYTLGSGWPTGGAEVAPEQAALELRSATITVTGPLHIHQAVPMPAPHTPSPIEKILPPPQSQEWPAAWAERLRARRRIVAMLAVRGDAPVMAARPGPANPFFPAQDDVARSGRLDPGSAIDLTGRVASDGMLDWDVPAGTWQLMTFTQEAEGRKVALAAGRGPQLVVDHFSRDAFDAYAAWHAAGLQGIAALAGYGLRSVFVDSFELTPENPWASDFLREFQARRGYALTPYLPLILLPGWMYPYGPQATRPLYTMGDTGARVLEDYHHTVSDLMQERFFRPLRDWAHGHGLMLRQQAHGAPADLITSYGFADIPETEDLFYGPVGAFAGLARSAADVYGKPIVSAESMIVVGHALDATPALYKARADMFFASGVSELVEHGMPYPHGRANGIGWAPFGAVFGNDFDPANPLFTFLRPLNLYEARVQAVLRATAPIVPVVIYQDALYQHAELDVPHAHADALHTALQEAGYSADTMTLDGLLRSNIRRGALETPGGHRYAAIVVAGQPALARRAADRLAAFAGMGVHVLFVGRVPDRAEGLSGQSDDLAVRADVARIRGTRPPNGEPGALAALLKAAGVEPNFAFAGGDIPTYAEREAEGRRFLFLANPGERAMHVAFAVPYRGAVEIWHAWTGKVTGGSALAAGSGLAFDISLPAYGSALLSVDTARPFSARSAVVADPVVTQTLGQGGWDVAAVGFNAAAQAVDAALHLDTLRDWREIPALGNFSGRAAYTVHFTLSSRPDAHVLVSLGTVHDAARVTLNGCRAGVVMQPWLVDATQAARKGENTLTVTVANAPQNGESGRRLATPQPVQGTVAAGLMGPVTILSAPAADADMPALACAGAPG